MKQTLVEVLDRHAAAQPAAIAYRYLADGERESATRSFEQLASRARAVAAWLLAQGLDRKKILIAVRDELGFLDAFLGCLYAGCVAVPVTLPRRDRESSTVASIAHSSGASAVLANRDEASLHGALTTALPELPMMYLQDAPAAGLQWNGPRCVPEDLAFLQYTSGSTGTPKGVMVTHGNLMANELAIKHAMQLGDSTVFVSWLPLFHDMGLIGSALQPLYLGVSCVLMPPQAFLQKPVRWINAISNYRGTTSGAPNFAYDLCVDKTTEEQRTGVDLSSWTVAFNGSEPVRAETLERFAAAFKNSGFERRSFYPCYGMAEGTLIVTGPVPGTELVTARFDTATLQDGQVVRLAAPEEPGNSLVGCGSPVVGTEVQIVDTVALQPVPAGQVGEIWIGGASVTSGYFNDEEQTAAALGVRLSGREDSPFLRTGDLGCVFNGVLFIIGRRKDIIIIRGRKHHPQDLERTAAASNAMLAAGGGAAFGVEGERGEVLVLVHELTRQGWRSADPKTVSADVRQALVREHGVTVAAVVLIKPGTLPRTSSGKVRRSLCRQLLQANELEVLQGVAEEV